MAAKSQGGSPEEAHHGLVPVIVVRTRELAEEYVELFGDHDIDATIGDDDLEEQAAADEAVRRIPAGGIPILVPEEMLDEAREILADREDVEEFALVVDEDDDFDDEDDEDDELGVVVDIDGDEDDDFDDEDEDEDDEDEEYDEDEEDF